MAFSVRNAPVFLLGVNSLTLSYGFPLGIQRWKGWLGSQRRKGNGHFIEMTNYHRRDIPYQSPSCGLTDWLAGCWLTEWLTAWLLTDWMIDWLADCLAVDWLDGWLAANWLNDWLPAWLLADCLAADWLNDWLAGWLTGCLLTEWLTGWLTWLADWLSEWMADWLKDWRNGRLDDWLADWLNEWIPVWLTEWLTSWMTNWLAGWLLGPYLENGWPSSSLAFSSIISEAVIMFVFLFTGFPRISWNVGAESKYSEAVKIAFSYKLDPPSTAKRGLPFIHQAW